MSAPTGAPAKVWRRDVLHPIEVVLKVAPFVGHAKTQSFLQQASHRLPVGIGRIAGCQPGALAK